MARASRAASSAGSLRRWKAIRCADLGPIPGSRPSSSISAWTGGAYVAGMRSALVDELGAGERLGHSLERRDVVLRPGVHELGRVDGLFGVGIGLTA